MKDVQFAIISGDVSDFGYDADMKIAKKILDELKEPYHIVHGNHDTKWSESVATVFREVFDHRNIDFNYGNIEFIGFQTGPILRRGNGYITLEDFKWVSDKVKVPKRKGRFIIPYTHYPLNGAMSNWYKLTNFFKEYSVPVVLVGYGHRNQKMNFAGIRGVMARTNPSAKSRRGERPVGYNIVDVTSDSIFFTEVNPEIHKSTLWNCLSIKSIHYPENKRDHLPDLCVNDTFPQVTTVWKAVFPGGISSSAAYSADRVVVGDRDGIVHCLSLKSGKKIWEFKTGKSVFSTPVIENKKVVFGSADSNIYYLNFDNGKPLWKFKADRWVLGNPETDGGGKVFIGASDGKFHLAKG